MDVNFEYYKVFYHVATEGSMTAAAKNLGLDQPNVSRIIKKLEYELGFDLFSRENRTLILTKQGAEVFSKIRPAIFQLELFQVQLESAKQYTTDKISICCSNTAFNYLNSKLKKFKDNHPNLNMSLHIITEREALDLISEEKMDIAFIALPNKPSYPFVALEMYEFEDILCVGEELAPLLADVDSLSSLKNVDFILPQSNCIFREHLDSFFNFYRFKPRSTIEVPRIDQIAYMIANNWGIGFLPKFCIDEIYLNSTFSHIKIKEDLLPRNIYSITKAGHKRSPITVELAQFLYDNNFPI